MKKYIVGIDFGHGETAAWVVPIKDVPEANMKDEGEALKLSMSNLSANDRLMDSIVCCSKDGDFSLESRNSSSIYTELKSPVSKLNNDPQKKAAYIKYIQLVVERVLFANETLLKKEEDDWNFYLCIACPTRWGEKEMDDYIQFFNDALSEKGISVLWVINESDAAFFTHRPKDNPNQCVLVVDYGSSTIDYTVIHNGKKISDDDWSSDTLGASCIEKAVLSAYKDSKEYNYQDAYSNTERILYETGNQHMKVYPRLLYNARKQKEDCFKTGKYPYYDFDFNFGKYVGLFSKNNPFKPYQFEFSGNLQEIIGDYVNNVLESFQNLNEQIHKRLGAQEVKKIILSGGACIMPWVLSMVKAVFPNAEEIVLDRDPSYVVAKGIALYAQAQFVALNDLYSAVNRIDFKEIYKKADMASTAESISQMSYLVKDSIKNKYNTPDGGDIHLEFRKFLYGLDGSNEKYCNIFSSAINKLIADEVYNHINRILKQKFSKDIERDEIELYLKIPVSTWPPEMLDVNGKYSYLMKGWIESAAVSYGIASSWGPDTFNWEKSRYPIQCEQLVNGTISRMVDYFKYNSDSISYDSTGLEIVACSVKNSTWENAIMLFKKHQLFKTTFS